VATTREVITRPSLPTTHTKTQNKTHPQRLTLVAALSLPLRASPARGALVKEPDHMPREHTTNDKEYARNRRILLADNPPCTYCGRLADTADHIMPHALGGSNDLSNLTPACRSCNSSRGAKLGNRLRALKELGQIIEPTTHSSGGITSPALNEAVKPNNGAEF